MKIRVLTFIGLLLGLIVLLVVMGRADLPALLRTWNLAGWTLLWVIPYRVVFFVLYAIGWSLLLRAYDPMHRAGLPYLFWVTTVREAVDRLLPVASVGGSLIGIRLLRRRGLATAPVTAGVIVEILLTLIASYCFTALGLLMLIDAHTADSQYRRLTWLFLISVPVPVASLALLRYGSVFKRLQRFARGLIGGSATTAAAAALDRELRAILSRPRPLLGAGALQLTALISGSFEVWFALRLFDAPVSIPAAVILESTTQAVRHLAFLVPAGVGVQEAGLILFGHAIGISAELALAVSMTKRLRELLCGLPALISWQWLETKRAYTF